MASLIPIKQHYGEKAKGKTLRFVSDCIVSFDITGTVVDDEIEKGELVFVVKEADSGKLIRIGDHTPKLKVTEL